MIWLDYANSPPQAGERDIYHSQRASKIMKPFCGKPLCEYICQLIPKRNAGYSNIEFLRRKYFYDEWAHETR